MTIDHVPYRWRPTSAEFNAWIDEINDALNFGYDTVSTNTTLGADHHVVDVDDSGGARTITLPTAVGIAGRTYTIRKGWNNANAVTINTTSGQFVNDFASGAGALKLCAWGAAITVVSDGTNWAIVSRQRSMKITYTPTLLGAAGNPTLGTGGSASAWWVDDGEFIEGQFYITFGTSGTSPGTGIYQLNLPVTAANNFTYGYMGYGLFYDSSSGFNYHLFLEQNGGISQVVFDLTNVAGKLHSSSPTIPAASDNIRGTFRYYKG